MFICNSMCKFRTFALLKNGTVAEWLGGGLQNLIQRFESARYLKSNPRNAVFTGVLFCLQ